MKQPKIDELSNRIFEPHGTRFLETCSRWFLIFCIFVAGIIIYIHLVYEVAPVSGDSMQPTLNQYGDKLKDTVIINKFLKYGYGDIIVVDRSTNNGAANFHIKRVIGMAGDVIDIVYMDYEDDNKDGYYVERNGKILEEKYILNRDGMISTHQHFEDLKGTTDFQKNFNADGKLIVPKGTVFVLGDNRGQSLDSSTNGPYPTKDVVGKVQYVVPGGKTPFQYIITNLFKLVKESNYLYRNVD